MGRKRIRLTEEQFKRNMKYRKTSSEVIKRYTDNIINENLYQGEYCVEWEFHNNKTGSPDDMTRGRNKRSVSSDKGIKHFSDEEEAYQFFLEKMQNHEGEYAVKFRLSYDGTPIEDLSGTRLFGGRIKGNETFDTEWKRDLRKRIEDEGEGDPTPYGSYRDESGYYLKTPRQFPLK